ncbi:MAG: hypothetical protein C0449_20580 [Polaromonas sp.]|nr:hypothetical protein [Polaromonas sp.]MBA4262858.1 hypothetical protein [Comamonadaceae bacterium]
MASSTRAQHPIHRTRLLASALLGAVLLCACAAPPGSDEPAQDTDQAADDQAPPIVGSEWAQHNLIDGLASPPGPWIHLRYGNRKPTRYTPQTHQGRPAVLAQAQASNSTLRLRLDNAALRGTEHLSFSWFVPALNERADLRDDDADDAVVRVVLSFDGDRTRLSSRDHVLSELAALITGEPLPFATLMYVWDNRYPVGSVIPNPHTERIRQLVVESGPGRLNQWVNHERDIEADFRLAFGEAPVRLTGVGLMSDSNNTGESVSAWFGPLTLTRTARSAPPPY